MPPPAGNAASTLFPFLLFPHIAWWAAALQCPGTVLLHTGPPPQNLGYRNRYLIAAAHGPLLLSVPVQGGRRAAASVGDTRPDDARDWRRLHWHTLFSAYGRAPYFEHYSAGLKALLDAPYSSLADLNLAAICWLAEGLQLPLFFKMTDRMKADEQAAYWHLARPPETFSLPVYHQVFEARHGFLPGLSAIDLLMNEGPYAVRYLRLQR